MTKKYLKELIQLIEATDIPENRINSLVLDQLFSEYKLNLVTLILSIQDRHSQEQKELIQDLRQAVIFSTWSVNSKYKKITAKDIPLLFPIVLANFKDGLQGKSQGEINFFNKFKKAFLTNQINFSVDWLEQYGYEVITKQFINE